MVNGYAALLPLLATTIASYNHLPNHPSIAGHRVELVLEQLSPKKKPIDADAEWMECIANLAGLTASSPNR